MLFLSIGSGKGGARGAGELGGLNLPVFTVTP